MFCLYREAWLTDSCIPSLHGYMVPKPNEWRGLMFQAQGMMKLGISQKVRIYSMKFWMLNPFVKSKPSLARVASIAQGPVYT